MKEAHKYKEGRKEVARFMRRLYNQGLTTTSGGNISMRLPDDIVLITPSATDKGRMKWKDVGILTMAGENLTSELKPSMETEMHLSIYRKMENIKAIVHAHPVFATSFTAMRREINTALTAEACVILGEPGFGPYALMGTDGLAANVSDFISESEILLLENHGILAVGSTMLQAFDRIEVLEAAARMTVIVELMGRKRELSQSRISELKDLFR